MRQIANDTALWDAVLRQRSWAIGQSSNAPKLARATLALAEALRYDADVSRADKELIILRATQLARGDYQFGQHRRLTISCGIIEEQIESLPRWRDSKLFSDRQHAVLAIANAMASPEGVDDATFDAMKAFTATRRSSN